MKKFSENPQVYVTLQAIVQHELDSGTHDAKNSATDALLWLKRLDCFMISAQTAL